MSQVSKPALLVQTCLSFQNNNSLISELITRYLKERKQFGAPLAAFQINQEKLIRMLANVQAMVLMGWRLCKLYENGKMTAGQASLGKVSFQILVLCHALLIANWMCICLKHVYSSVLDHLEGKGNCCAWTGVAWWKWNLS